MNTVLLQASSPGITNILMMVGIFVVFYFFMIRPQQKKQKDAKKFREALKKGDEVVTIGGVHGTIVAVEADTVVLDVDRGTKLTIDRSAVGADLSKG